jgi:hypothetical protein
MKPFFLICILLASTCNQPKDVLERATMQGYSGGAVGSNPGYNYRIYLKMKDTTIHFDSLWTGNRRMQAARLPEESSAEEQVIFANQMMPYSGPQQRTEVDTTHYKMPVQTDAAGVLRYYVKGKPKYLLIPSWSILPRAKYP